MPPRRTTPTTDLTPAEIASRIVQHNVKDIATEQDYRGYTNDLEELVEQLTGTKDRGLIIRVADELGTGLEAWYKHRLKRKRRGGVIR